MGSDTGLKFKKLDAPVVTRTTAVSPMPRAMARMAAVTSPARALGSTTFHVVFQWVAPSASLASRKPPGTTRSATSEARATSGNIVTAMAIAAASPVLPSPKPTTKVAYTNRPAKMSESAVIASTTVRIRCEPGPLTSVMYTAVPMPRGTATTTAIPTMITVPTMAWKIPPWFSGAVVDTPAMSWVKKLTWTKARQPSTNV